jgi:hypothetical protein
MRVLYAAWREHQTKNIQSKIYAAEFLDKFDVSSKSTYMFKTISLHKSRPYHDMGKIMVG